MQGSAERDRKVQRGLLPDLLALDRMVAVFDNLRRWIAKEDQRMSTDYNVVNVVIVVGVETYLRRRI